MAKGRSNQGRSRPPLQRMMRIHGAIQAGKYPNTRMLGEEFEMSPRSILRDIEFMRDRMDLPIEYDGARHGYYYSQEVSAFPSLQISEGELFALLVAEKALQQYRGTSFEKPLVSALKKMSESLPETVSITFGEWDDSISFRTSAEPILDLGLFDTLAQATARREQLRLLYRKPGGKTEECRVVDPHHLANVNGEWFLFGYCHLRKDIRTFVPARMKKIEKTGEVFKRRKGFSVKEQLRDSFGVHSGRGEFQVVVRFSDRVADYIREKKWHPSQKLRELKDGELEMTLTLSSLVEVRRWILNWGRDARAVAPRELVEEVRAEAEAVLRQYDGESGEAETGGDLRGAQAGDKEGFAAGGVAAGDLH